MSSAKSILHSLEVVARGPLEGSYPVSPKLFDPDVFEEWRKNILETGNRNDLKRYTKAITNDYVISTLDLERGC